MHPYSTDSPAKHTLLFFIAIVAIAVAGVVGWLTDFVNQFTGLTVGGASALTCFAILYALFDKFCWRWRLVRRFLLVPDLNGTWACSARTSMKNAEPVDWPWEATITIRQSWSRIIIRLKTSQSESASIGASLDRRPGQGYRLVYHYDNSPSTSQHELHRHSGLCDLVFSDDGASAEGEYFTGKDRFTAGTMTLKRKEPIHGKTRKTRKASTR